MDCPTAFSFKIVTVADAVVGDIIARPLSSSLLFASEITAIESTPKSKLISTATHWQRSITSLYRNTTKIAVLDSKLPFTLRADKKLAGEMITPTRPVWIMLMLILEKLPKQIVKFGRNHQYVHLTSIPGKVTLRIEDDRVTLFWCEGGSGKLLTKTYGNVENPNFQALICEAIVDKQCASSIV